MTAEATKFVYCSELPRGELRTSFAGRAWPRKTRPTGYYYRTAPSTAKTCIPSTRDPSAGWQRGSSVGTGSVPLMPRRLAIDLSSYLLIPTPRPCGEFEIHYGEVSEEREIAAVALPVLPQRSPMERAQQLQSLLDIGEVGSRAELTRLLGCPRAAVTKALPPLAVTRAGP
jgi:hypothetical protein